MQNLPDPQERNQQLRDEIADYTSTIHLAGWALAVGLLVVTAMITLISSDILQGHVSPVILWFGVLAFVIAIIAFLAVMIVAVYKRSLAKRSLRDRGAED